jgi:hypothetical protein
MSRQDPYPAGYVKNWPPGSGPGSVIQNYESSDPDPKKEPIHGNTTLLVNKSKNLQFTGSSLIIDHTA